MQIKIHYSISATALDGSEKSRVRSDGWMKTEGGGDERVSDLPWQHFRPKEHHQTLQGCKATESPSWLNLCSFD